MISARKPMPEATPAKTEFKREEVIHLSYKNPVSEIIKFYAGETVFTIEANIVRRDYILLSLGGFDMSGKIINFHSRDFHKEFGMEQFQWLILKADHLKEGQELEIKIKFR